MLSVICIPYSLRTCFCKDAVLKLRLAGLPSLKEATSEKHFKSFLSNQRSCPRGEHMPSRDDPHRVIEL